MFEQPFSREELAHRLSKVNLSINQASKMVDAAVLPSETLQAAKHKHDKAIDFIEITRQQIADTLIKGERAINFGAIVRHLSTIDFANLQDDSCQMLLLDFAQDAYRILQMDDPKLPDIGAEHNNSVGEEVEGSLMWLNDAVEHMMSGKDN